MANSGTIERKWCVKGVQMMGRIRLEDSSGEWSVDDNEDGVGGEEDVDVIISRYSPRWLGRWSASLSISISWVQVSPSACSYGLFLALNID